MITISRSKFTRKIHTKSFHYIKSYGNLKVRNAFVTRGRSNMAKRSNGEGMIRQRADGRWESRVMIGYKDNGKPDYKSVYGKTKKKPEKN